MLSYYFDIFDVSRYVLNMFDVLNIFDVLNLFDVLNMFDVIDTI